MKKLLVKDIDSIVAKIVAKDGTTFCTVQDRKGRKFNAASDGSYNVGQSVLIKDGVVISVVKRATTIPHFNV